MQKPANPIIYSNFNYYELVVNGQVSDHRLPQFSSNDPSFALQFIANARVDDYQWPILLQGLELTAASAQAGLYQQIAQHMMANRIQFYELPSLRNATAASVSGGKGWCFVPSITNTHHGVDVYQKQSFNTVEKAKAFIDTIPFTAASMAKTLESSGIKTPKAGQAKSEALQITEGKALLANSMAAGDTWGYLTEQTNSQWLRPKTSNASANIETASGVHAKPVPLAPETAVPSAAVVAAAVAKATEVAKDEETVLECQVTKFSVKDKENRTVVITPETVGEIELEVVSAYKGDKVEQITATLDGNAICGEHGNSSSQLSPSADSHLKNPIQKSFNKNIYKVNSHKVSPSLSNIWLPNIKPKRYVLNSQGCNNLSPNKVHILAYPHIKWEGNFGFDFGGKEKEVEQSSIKGLTSDIDTKKTTVSNKASKWYGDLSCTIDAGPPQKFLSEYEQKSKDVLDTFSQIKDNVDGVLKTLKDGSTTKLGIGWPNLSVGYTAEFIEDTAGRGVGVDYHINFKAKPLLKIDASIDIYKGLLNASRGHPLSEVLLQMEKGIGSDKTLISAQVKAELVLSLSTNIDLVFDAAGNTLNDDKKKTIDTDLGFGIQLEGKLEAKGHVWIVSFAAGAKVGIKSGWVGKIQVVKDDAGVYLQKGFFFNGLIVYYSYYFNMNKATDSKAKAKSKYAAKRRPKPVYESSDNFVWIAKDPELGSEKDIELNNREKLYLIENKVG